NIDSDKDGLMDAEEELIGSNPNKVDTDGDGLNDKFEVEAGLNPIKKDSDDNGKLDTDEDIDDDGLTNLEEHNYKTNPIFEDTDGDGLNDSDEINKHNTDPNKEDTDNDGLNDSNEIKLGTNPNKEDTNENGIKDGQEQYQIDIEVRESEKDENIDISVSGDIKGEYIDEIYTSNMEGSHTFLRSDMPGYVGAPFRVGILEEDITQELELTFKINANKLKNIGNKEVGLYVYNKKENVLERITENVKITKSNEIKAKVSISDYREYILLIADEWDEAWHKEMLAPGATKKDLDVVLAIDSSGSMGSNDRNDIRKSESKKFVDKLEGENRAAVVDFDSYAQLKQGLTTEKESLKSAIDTIDSSGGTNISRAIETSVKALDSNTKNITYKNNNENIYQTEDDRHSLGNNEEYNEDNRVEEEIIITEEHSKSNEDKLKTVVLLTDGQSSVSQNDAYLNYAAENDIKIFTAGLGSGVNESTLRMIASKTGAKYLHAMKAEDLVELFNELTEQTIDITTDSDNDGIPNYFERNLRLENGTILQLDPNNPDTDGDGLSDGFEITGFDNPTPEQLRAKYVQGEKPYFNIISRPDISDTDNDGILDKGEINGSNDIVGESDPKVPNITTKTLLKFSQLSYEKLYKGYIGGKVGNIPGILGNEEYGISITREDINSWDVIDLNNGRGIVSGFGALAVKSGRNLIVAYPGTKLDLG
ncbi:MAG: VWA domain-containing protein, partial [Paraclostridium sp.]